MTRRITWNYQKTFAGAMLLSCALWLLVVIFTGAAPSVMNVFYKGGEELFYDFFHSIGVAAQPNPYDAIPPQGQDHAYPPLAYVIFAVFRGLVHVDGVYDFGNVSDIAGVRPLTIILMVLYALFAAALFVLVKKQLGSTVSALLLTLALIAGKPVLYAMERGNIILLCMLLNTFFIFYHNSESHLLRELSLIALAVSAGIKLTPAVLGVMLIYNRQWKEAARTLLYGIVAAVAPFLFFDGGLTLIPQFLRDINEHLTSYRITNGTIYGCLQNIRHFYDFEFLYQSAKVISILTAVLILVAVPLMKHRWQKVLALSMILVFAPSVSQFYCLIHLVPAIIVFVAENKNQSLEDRIVFVLLCVIGLMAPTMYLSAIAELMLVGYLGILAVVLIVEKLRPAGRGRQTA